MSYMNIKIRSKTLDIPQVSKHSHGLYVPLVQHGPEMGLWT